MFEDTASQLDAPEVPSQRAATGAELRALLAPQEAQRKAEAAGGPETAVNRLT